MAEDINKNIIDKLNESEFENEIKSFLIKLLVLELDNFEEGRWRYSEKYDREIINYAHKFEEEKI